jgi:hypothetical protein
LARRPVAVVGERAFGELGGDPPQSIGQRVADQLVDVAVVLVHGAPVHVGRLGHGRDGEPGRLVLQQPQGRGPELVPGA